MRAALVPLLMLVAACGSERIDPAPALPASLAELALYDGPLADLHPAKGVLPYEVSAQLWADGARKSRFIALPDGETATFDAGEAWAFPIGTKVIKNFYFSLDPRAADGPRRIIETRVLRFEEAGWTPYVYRWNDDQTEAKLSPGGSRVNVVAVDDGGKTSVREYVVPNTNQCSNCHARGHSLHLLGVTTPQLDIDVSRGGKTVNQLRWLQQRGVVGGASIDPKAYAHLEDPFGGASLELRARSWLHANCAHCHRSGGGAESTALTLLFGENDATHIGICKPPVAAGSGTGGKKFDIVPGKPDDSIMPFRIASTAPQIKMPELPNRVPDAKGLALIRAWISAMPPQACE